MAGLFIKELIARGDLQRCLVVCPGMLAEQWQDELHRRFHLPFEILTNDKLEAARTGNWFLENDLVIARLDKLSRDEDVQKKLSAPASSAHFAPPFLSAASAFRKNANSFVTLIKTAPLSFPGRRTRNKNFSFGGRVVSVSISHVLEPLAIGSRSRGRGNLATSGSDGGGTL
jgi:hypothetical protein